MHALAQTTDTPTIRFADFRGRHRGDTVVVCGCGVSLNQLQRPEQFVTIGVNDVGRLFTPTYLVVVNDRSQFARERYVHVEQSRAQFVFSQLDLPHPRTVRFRLGKRGGTDCTDANSLHYTNNSPYVAVNLARHLGAARIGLIGVDFQDHHFFGATGRHSLASQLAQIDHEYAGLEAACRADGVELVNLSAGSRLTSLPRATPEEWLGSGTASRSDLRESQPTSLATPARVSAVAARRVFFVHYRFLSCGTVFDTGLRDAANALGIASEHAYWDDSRLPHKIEQFQPDLLFVVHGRRFIQHWARRLTARSTSYRSAVWLLDEPYEVDDTASWSHHFDLVFVNDAATQPRHRNSHELLVAYTPKLHYVPPESARPYRVGFIGGANPTRERMLGGLARRRLLDYVVGGPWSDPRLGERCLAMNVPAEKTAELYRSTEIVVNVFRDRHHFNRAGIEARALNPRICEALACGALVISEPRDDLTRLVPDLPTFRSEAEAAALIEHFCERPEDRERVQLACSAQLADATYAHRLRKVMEIAFDPTTAVQGVLHGPAPELEPADPPPQVSEATAAPTPGTVPFNVDWDCVGGVARLAGDGCVVLDADTCKGAGAERGLASRARFDAVDLAFEARLGPGACLLAKVHQADRIDQTTNSYHLLVDERHAYLARHHHVFRQFESPRLTWTQYRLVCRDGELSLWRNGQVLHRVRDRVLTSGFAFIGARGGGVRVRNLTIATPGKARARQTLPDEVEELIPLSTPLPRISIVTTVYDRVSCLQRCLESVQQLAFSQFEHLVVADHPPREILSALRETVSQVGDARVGLLNLRRRFNNWGIAPAAAGLRRARGEFIAFLSDDNGYTSDHFEPLVRLLDREPALGFVYSSCRYDGRLVLNHPVPRPGRIDLGQPLFRRELFERFFDDDLPFDMMAWDWHMIDALMRKGVRWRHVDRQSFIFRLARYPQLA